MSGSYRPPQATVLVRSSLVCLFLACVFLVSACGEVAPGGGSTARDSSDVSIVANPDGSVEAAERWALSAEPTFDIGSGADPAVSLFRVVHVLTLEAGRVAIGMTAPPQVLVVGADGQVEATLGREGDGPGEYMGVGSVVALGADSLAVWDPERRRISVFTYDGAFRREVDLRQEAPLSWIASPNVSEPSARTYLLPSAPGSLVLFSVGMFGPGDGVRRVAAPTKRIGVDGRLLADYGSFPGEATFMSDATGAAPYLLGPDTHATTFQDELVVGTADEAEYRVYGPDGSLRRIVRWPAPDRTVVRTTFPEWTRFVESFLSSMPPAEANGIRDILDAMPDPERLPAFGALIGSDAGDVWIGPYRPGHLTLGVAYMGRPRVPGQEWLVFGADGALRATVSMPAGLRPMTVSRGRVWGVHTDALDVESVRAYDIVVGR